MGSGCQRVRGGKGRLRAGGLAGWAGAGPAGLVSAQLAGLPLFFCSFIFLFLFFCFLFDFDTF